MHANDTIQKGTIIIGKSENKLNQKMGRPRKEIDVRQFVDLVSLGCTQDEICWFFRDESGKPTSEDTITRWCKREFGCTFAEYRKKNSGMGLRIQLRRNQFALSEKNAAMAIWLGKQYLGQTETPITVETNNSKLNSLIDGIEQIRNELKQNEE